MTEQDNRMTTYGERLAKCEDSSRSAHHRITEAQEADIRIEAKVDKISDSVRTLEQTNLQSMAASEKYSKRAIKISVIAIAVLVVVVVSLIKAQLVSTQDVLNAVKTGSAVSGIVI